MLTQKKNTKSIILKTAADEIYRNGYESTSLSDLIAKTNLSKGAFYHYFKSKQQLCLELIDLYAQKEIEKEWLNRFNTPLNTINVLLKSIENKIQLYYQNGDYKYGSAINNLLNEQSSIDEKIRNKLINKFDIWVSETSRFIKQGQKSEYVKKGFEAKQIAQFFIQNAIAALQVLKTSHNLEEATQYFKILRKTARTFRAD